MVSEYSDLVLQNSSPYPVYLDAACNGQTLSFTLYGYPTHTVKLRSEKIKTIPCRDYEITYGDVPSTTPPVDGAVYQSYRDFYRNGTLFATEKLRLSAYAPTLGKIVLVPDE